MLRLEGSQHFRQRIALSTLSGRPIRIDKIREKDQAPGLRDFEACLLRLIEKITNGCLVEINETGTSLRYKPGFIVGGDLTHDCGKSRGIGYFLEPLACIALFGRKPLRITLRGITNDGKEPGIDIWRTVTFPLIRSLVGIDDLDDLQLKIVRRGCPPLGGGEVWVNIPVIQSIPSINRKEEGMVKRVRGLAFTAKVSVQVGNQLSNGAKEILNKLLPDVWVFTDHVSGVEAGLSPGFGLALVAETTTKALIGAESMPVPSDKARQQDMTPEDVGRRTAYELLSQIKSGGVIDATHQGLALLLCALGPDELNELRLSALTPYAVRTLRHIKEFLGVTFSIIPEEESETLFVACIGSALKNVARRVT